MPVQRACVCLVRSGLQDFCDEKSFKKKKKVKRGYAKKKENNAGLEPVRFRGSGVLDLGQPR
jgi:hypothetical protein